VSAYAVAGAHRHTPEIEQALTETGRWTAYEPAAVRVSFTPVLAPMPRGILATCTARLTTPETTTADLRDAIAAAYADEPFVTLLPVGTWPATASVAGSNAVHHNGDDSARAGPSSSRRSTTSARARPVRVSGLGCVGLPETVSLPPSGRAVIEGTR
jgi:N-acetyl-gamma-glutamyl-phosphate reductase